MTLCDSLDAEKFVIPFSVKKMCANAFNSVYEVQRSYYSMSYL